MTRQLLQSPTNAVVAACRTPSKAAELQELAKGAEGKLYIVSIDIDDPESIRACADDVAKLLGDRGVDYIVNNAAVVRHIQHV